MDLSQKIDDVTTLVPWRIDVLIENETAINLTPSQSSVNCSSSLSYLSHVNALPLSGKRYQNWKWPQPGEVMADSVASIECMYIGRGNDNCHPTVTPS